MIAVLQDDDKQFANHCCVCLCGVKVVSIFFQLNTKILNV